MWGVQVKNTNAQNKTIVELYEAGCGGHWSQLADIINWSILFLYNLIHASFLGPITHA